MPALPGRRSDILVIVFMNRWPDAFWKLVPVLVSLPAVVYMLALCGHGLDLTDESSYINWISDPWLYPLSVTQYGFLYHPIYWLVGGDIALLRGVNLVLTVGLAGGLGFVIFRATPDHSRRLDIGMAAAASVPFGFIAVLSTANWLVTPSYNSLNLQGLFVSAIALVLIGAPRTPARSRIRVSIAFALLGVGGWIVFLAKPPSAALLALVALAYLLSTHRLTFSGACVAAGISTCLLLLTAFAIDGSVPTFIRRLSDGAALSSAMDDSYTATRVLRIDPLRLRSTDKLLILGIAVLSATAIVLSTRRDNWAAQAFSFTAVVFGLTVAFLMLAGFRLVLPSAWYSEYTIQILAVPLGVLLALLPLLASRQLTAPVTGQLQLAVAFFVLPYAFAFGTNSNYWPLAAQAGLFWVAGAVVLIRAVYPAWGTPKTVVTTVLLPFALSVGIVGVGMEYPYRQTQPVRQDDQVVEVGAEGARLTLSADFATYVRQLQAIARANGFRRGDPLIDLTGHYPGAPFVLGAVPVGQAWMIGGYPGSEPLAAAALRRTSCAALAASWLLTEPSGPRAISQAVLGEYGMRFESVGSLASPMGSYPQSYQQYISRPVHIPQAVIDLCERKRQDSRPNPAR